VLTVEHILISCVNFGIICHIFYTASNLKNIFRNIHTIHTSGLISKL